MHFEFGLRSSLLLIFFTHLVVYAFLSLKRGIRQDRLSDKFLSAFLFCAALFIFPWMSGFAGWYDTQPYREILFYTPFIHALFFGPLLFFYLKSLTNSSYRLKKRDLLHFLPGLLYILWSMVIVLVDKAIVGGYYLMDGRRDPDFDRGYSILWSLSILIYLVSAIRYYLSYRVFSYLEFSFAATAGFKWLRNFLYAFALLTVLLVSEQILSLFMNLAYVKSWYYFFAFALISYYMAISAYNARTITPIKLNFEPALLLEYQQPLSLVEQNEQRTDGSAVPVNGMPADDQWMDLWESGLQEILKEEKIYLQPELTLSELARKLGTNPSLLSKVINSRFKMNFNDLINGFRVEEAISLLGDKRYQHLNLLAVAFDAGFNSKSTFNRAFKKHTGCSPKDYLSRPEL